MKFIRLTTLVLLAGITLMFSSCYRTHHTDVTPSYTYTFDDEFDNNYNNWAFSDPSNNAFVDINNGMLEYSYFPRSQGTNTVAVQGGLNTNSDFYIQTRVRTDNTIGLAFGVSNHDYGYAFMIDASGNYALYYEGTSTVSPQPIIDWTGSSTISLNGWNTLEIDQVNGYWIGYINNTQVFKVAGEYFGGSKIGFITESNTYGGSDSYADYLTAGWY